MSSDHNNSHPRRLTISDKFLQITAQTTSSNTNNNLLPMNSNTSFSNNDNTDPSATLSRTGSFSSTQGSIADRFLHQSFIAEKKEMAQRTYVDLEAAVGREIKVHMRRNVREATDTAVRLQKTCSQQLSDPASSHQVTPPGIFHTAVKLHRRYKDIEKHFNNYLKKCGASVGEASMEDIITKLRNWLLMKTNIESVTHAIDGFMEHNLITDTNVEDVLGVFLRLLLPRIDAATVTATIQKFSQRTLLQPHAVESRFEIVTCCHQLGDYVLEECGDGEPYYQSMSQTYLETAKASVAASKMWKTMQSVRITSGLALRHKEQNATSTSHASPVSKAILQGARRDAIAMTMATHNLTSEDAAKHVAAFEANHGDVKSYGIPKPSSAAMSDSSSDEENIQYEMKRAAERYLQRFGTFMAEEPHACSTGSLPPEFEGVLPAASEMHHNITMQSLHEILTLTNLAMNGKFAELNLMGDIAKQTNERLLQIAAAAAVGGMPMHASVENETMLFNDIVAKHPMPSLPSDVFVVHAHESATQYQQRVAGCVQATLLQYANVCAQEVHHRHAMSHSLLHPTPTTTTLSSSTSPRRDPKRDEIIRATRTCNERLKVEQLTQGALKVMDAYEKQAILSTAQGESKSKARMAAIHMLRSVEDRHIANKDLVQYVKAFEKKTNILASLKTLPVDSEDSALKLYLASLLSFHQEHEVPHSSSQKDSPDEDEYDFEFAKHREAYLRHFEDYVSQPQPQQQQQQPQPPPPQAEAQPSSYTEELLRYQQRMAQPPPPPPPLQAEAQPSSYTEELLRYQQRMAQAAAATTTGTTQEETTNEDVKAVQAAIESIYDDEYEAELARYRLRCGNTAEDVSSPLELLPTEKPAQYIQKVCEFHEGITSALSSKLGTPVTQPLVVLSVEDVQELIASRGSDSEAEWKQAVNDKVSRAHKALAKMMLTPAGMQAFKASENPSEQADNMVASAPNPKSEGFTRSSSKQDVLETIPTSTPPPTSTTASLSRRTSILRNDVKQNVASSSRRTSFAVPQPSELTNVYPAEPEGMLTERKPSFSNVIPALTPLQADLAVQGSTQNANNNTPSRQTSFLVGDRTASANHLQRIDSRAALVTDSFFVGRGTTAPQQIQIKPTREDKLRNLQNVVESLPELLRLPPKPPMDPEEEAWRAFQARWFHATGDGDPPPAPIRTVADILPNVEGYATESERLWKLYKALKAKYSDATNSRRTSYQAPSRVQSSLQGYVDMLQQQQQQQQQTFSRLDSFRTA
eukprot:PhF_6_TR27970/c0_g1_i5/m.41351